MGAQRDATRRGGRWLVVLGLALTVAGCGASTVGRTGNKYGVRASPKVVADGDPVPKGGGRAMVGQPYVVGGRTYVPHEGKGYVREGWASWYGTAFHGRLTANGEVFDRGSIAAAHPTLPLPSYVRVTNVVNRRSMVVRVNDRGPYERDRILDVSERAADALGFHRRGTTRIRVQYLGRASLAGSDDARLLASLTTDGTDATLGPAMSGTRLADLRDPPARRATPPDPEPPRPIRVAEADPEPADEGLPREAARAPARDIPAAMRPAGDVGPPVRPVVAVPVRSAGLDGPPVDALPPERPGLVGLY